VAKGREHNVAGARGTGGGLAEKGTRRDASGSELERAGLIAEGRELGGKAVAGAFGMRALASDRFRARGVCRE